MRPRFQIGFAETPREILCRLKESLDRSDSAIEGELFGNHAVLRIPEEATHFWSPQLTIDVEPGLDGDSAVINGLFGPRPAVWTLFMAMYSMWVFSGLFGLIIGLSQWSLGRSPVFLWSIPIAGLLCLVVYGLALYGQRLGYEQMVELRTFLESSVARDIA
jgi:hypothetical protein